MDNLKRLWIENEDYGNVKDVQQLFGTDESN